MRSVTMWRVACELFASFFCSRFFARCLRRVRSVAMWRVGCELFASFFFFEVFATCRRSVCGGSAVGCNVAAGGELFASWLRVGCELFASFFFFRGFCNVSATCLRRVCCRLQRSCQWWRIVCGLFASAQDWCCRV